MVFARVRIISTAFAFCRIPALQRLYTQPAHPHNDIFLIATKKQTTVPSKLGKSKIQVDLVGNETWSTDEFKSLLRLTLRYREANRRISWQNLMHYVLGYTKETCNNQYRLILAQYQNCVSGCEIPDNYKNIVIELKELLKECSVLDEIYRTVTAKWTLEDDQRLLMLLNRGKAWSQIASEMGKFTERQCITRKYRLIDRKKKLDQQLLSGLELHQPLVMGTLPDGTTVALGEIEFIHRKVKKETPIFTKSWTQADDDKLYDLVTQQRRFDYEYLKSYFPEIGYNQMIMALQRISIQRDRGSDMWTKEEEEVLDNLIRKHGKKWTKIAREMPTERTAKQCYDHCRWRSKGTQLKSTIWSEKETILLEVLVELFMQNKLLPLSEQRTRASESTERTLIKLLAPGNSAPIDELQQVYNDLLKQKPHNLPSMQPGGQANKKISWKTIAPYMAPKTARQCLNRWGNIQIVRRRAMDTYYSGPWAREEDLKLYKLYTQAPRKWMWILKNLPRQRDYESVMMRYKNYIKYYLALLKRQRGAGWCPMDDQFEEVHRLCEIRAWRYRLLTGYRIKDGYMPPADLDLHGDKYCYL